MNLEKNTSHGNPGALRAIVRRLRGMRETSQQSSVDIAYLDASGVFDREWYLRLYPDVAESGMDAVRHYVLHGVTEGRDPCDGFSTRFYLENNPDVAASGVNPFRHYLEYGLKEGRKPLPEKRRGPVAPASEALTESGDAAIIAASGLFDRDYYLNTYRDVAKAGMDPVEHYVRYGANEGRNPRADFDTWFYLKENPDVARGQLNPFRHYIEYGLDEGRPGAPPTKRKIVKGPLVSIIIPVYAVEEYLDECLKSVASQTYRNLEIIVVDDGSPDGSYEIACAYAKADSRFSIVRRENGGLGAARNTGVAEATGRYLTFVDSDDVLPPDAISRMVSSLQHSGSDFVVGAMRRLKNGKLMPADGWVKEVHAEDRTRVRLCDFPEILTDVFAWNKVFDSAFFRQQVGRFPEKIRYEDQEPTAKAYLHGTFDVLASTVYHWRIREDGTSITQKKSDLDDLHDRLIVKERVSHILAGADKSTYETWLAKAMGFDLRPYFEQVPRTDESFFERLREGMLSLADNMTPQLWQRVRMIDRLPALAVLAGNRDDVCIAVTRRAEYGYFVPGRIAAGAAYLDGGYLEGMELSPGDDLLKFGDADLSVVTSVTSLSWAGSLLRLEGYAYLTNLEFGDDSWVRAKLVADGHEPIELNLRQRDCPRVDHETPDAWNSHARSGFAVDFDPSALGLDPDAAWRMEVAVGCLGLESSRSAILRDVDMRGIPDAPAVSAIREGSRWTAEVETGIGFVLRCVPSRDALVTAIDIEDGKVAITVEQTGADALLLVCETLRRRMEVAAAEVEAGRTVFSFMLPDVCRSDNREHLWHAYLCGQGEPQKLAWVGDTESLERECSGHRRIRPAVGKGGVLRLVQTCWWAVADELSVGEDSITIRGKVDAPGASTLSARLVGESQDLTADRVDYDAVAQRFELRFPFDLAVSEINSPLAQDRLGQAPQILQPTMLRGFVLRLSAAFQDQQYERRLRVADELQRQLPLDFASSRYSLAFTRTQGDAALWVQFRPPYREDERGRLAQHRLHSSIWHSAAARDGERPELEDAILFESFGGRQVSDSVLAICNEIARRRLDLAMYWTVADLGMPVPNGATPLLINSREWMQQLRRSRYLVNNNNFPFYFRKSAGQTYLQTWHGTPLKRIGNHVPRSNLSLPYRQLMRRESRYWDYLLVQNDYAAEILPAAFDFAGRVLNVGYPRNDTLVGSQASVRRLLVRNRFGFEPYHFVVLYAPTWRDNLSGARGYSRVSYLDFKGVGKVIGSNARFILRGHHNTARNHAVRQSNVIDATHYHDINDLLLAADLLITDYSSVMFDYAVTGKPVMFLTPDLEQYRDQTRGFYADLEETAPGPICYTSEELSEALSSLGNILETYSERYCEFRRRFAPRDDGAASARVVDAIWGQQEGAT